MSFFRSNKFITIICLLLSALLVTLGILAFLPAPECSAITGNTIAAASGNFSMFKSFSALKAWLAAIPYYIYLIVGLGLLIIAVGCLLVAIFKKARHRRNDVNVLILVGDEDEKVDATVFKEHYAVVVVAKPSSLAPVQPRVLPPIIPLENNKRYIPIPNENPRQNVEKEDIIVVSEVVQENKETTTASVENTQNVAPVVEQKVAAEEKPIVADKKPEPIKEIKPAVKQEEKQEPIRAVEQLVKPAAQAPIIVAEPEDEDPIIFEPIEQNNYAENIAYEDEPIAPIKQTVDMDQVFKNAYSDINTSNVEEESLYDESEFTADNFEEVKFEQDEFNVSPIIINQISDLTEEEPIVAPTNQSNNFECITVEEEVKPKVKEKVRNNESTYVVQEFEPITYTQNYQNDNGEMLFEEEAVADEVPLADISENSRQNNALLFVAANTSPKTNTEDAAYAIVKEKDAVPEAVEAVQNGAIIVDADGDDVVDEVLEDKDILKMRYKTVELDKRLKRADEEVKGYYSELKNTLLSYKGIKSRLSKKFDTFTLGRFIVAKLALRGNVINLYLALPSEQVDDKYFAEDVGDSDTYGKTPTLHKVKSKRGCKYGIELINELMTAIAVPVIANFEPINYVEMYPPENIEDKKREIAHLISERVFIEDTDVLSDEDAVEFIQIIKDKAHTINKFNPINKFVAFIDDIAELYEANEIVTIENLIEKGALPNMDNLFLEIRGKGYVDKILTVEAHSFDVKAVKMLTLSGGNVIQYK